jgi:antitoxin CcdA
MQPLVNSTKKATNITLSSDVLIEAKALGINISKTCDQFLRDLVRTERERRWQQDNADFIATYNQTAADEALPLDLWRSFWNAAFWCLSK